MSDTLSYTLRIPSNLKTFLDAEASKRGQSTASLVVEACWSYLEEPKDRGVAQRLEQGAHNTPVAGSNPAVTSITDLAAKLGLSSASALVSNPDAAKPKMNVQAVEQEAIEMCRVTSPYVDPEGYSDGEMYHCGLRAGHKGRCSKGPRV
jgi:predicted DNA-binding protein